MQYSNKISISFRLKALLPKLVFLLHTNVFAGEGPTFPAIKPIKIYTFRILELDRKKDQERPYRNHLGLERGSLRSKRFRLVSEQRNT